MGKFIPTNEIEDEFSKYPFLDAPEGYWNTAKEGRDGYEQIAIEDMTDKHKKNSIKMINERYIPLFKNRQDIQDLLISKVKELEGF